VNVKNMAHAQFSYMVRDFGRCLHIATTSKNEGDENEMQVSRD